MKNILVALGFIFWSLLSWSQKPDDTLHWSATRKLEWKDFGKPKAKTGVLGHAAMVMNAKFHKGLKATTSVEAVFDRNSSFATDNEKTPQMLKYYQVLFDLYEVESRKLRKTLKETKLGIDPEKVFQEKYTAAQAALDERAELYMEEAETGSNAAAIDKWAKMMQEELKQMEPWSKENQTKKP